MHQINDEARDTRVRLTRATVFPEGLIPTDMIPCLSIRYTMQQSNQATRVSNGLLEPHDFFLWTTTLIFLPSRIFLLPERLIRPADGKHEQDGIRRARDKCQQVWIIDAEHIMKGQLGGH